MLRNEGEGVRPGERTSTASAIDPNDLSAFSTNEDVKDYIHKTNNWGRWGSDDQRGAMNLVTPEVRVHAASLVQSGVAISLSRPLATVPGIANPRPVMHFMYQEVPLRGAGAALDYFSIACHGVANTHIDALTHIWDEDGKLYNGVDAESYLQFDGSRWGGIDQWREGFFTRAVLLDVPSFRSTPYVTQDQPVMAEELEDIARGQGVDLRPGDAVIVYSGRNRWDENNPPWSSTMSQRPGLDISCIKFFRVHDCAIIVWDMMDHAPTPHGRKWGVHSAIPAYGIALVDNAELGELATVCKKLMRYEFALAVNPLYLTSGTGTPANPIALL